METGVVHIELKSCVCKIWVSVSTFTLPQFVTKHNVFFVISNPLNVHQTITIQYGVHCSSTTCRYYIGAFICIRWIFNHSQSRCKHATRTVRLQSWTVHQKCPTETRLTEQIQWRLVLHYMTDLEKGKAVLTRCKFKWPEWLVGEQRGRVEKNLC